jgi:diguanylate cyclase (GGDEF)-like protein/PAS domain S-box-containing protein
MVSASDVLNASILIVDDQQPNVILLETMLHEAGYTCIASTTDPQAVCELHRKNCYDLILLDLQMPGFDGFQVMEGLKEIEPDGYLPVLVITAQPGHKTRALQAGAKDFISKPYDLIEVQTRIYNMLEVRLLYMESASYCKVLEDTVKELREAESVLRATEEVLFEEKERAQVTLNSIGDAVITADVKGNITYLNLVAERLTGWSRDNAMGRSLDQMFKIVDGTTRLPVQNPTESAIKLNSIVSASQNIVLIRRDGSEYGIEASAAPIHDRQGQVIGAVMVSHDVTEARVIALKMAYLAQHDFLTGLPNRTLLHDRIAQAIGLARRHHRQVALLYLDLDHFKNVNDSLGHAIGDQLLQSVAKRLTDSVRSSDTVCRQGGDEFVILLSEIEHVQEATQFAEKLLKALAIPHHIGGHELHVTMSIGISLYPDGGEDVEAVLRSADTAMYHAKESGRNNYQFFTQDMNTRAVERSALEGSLRRALSRGEFVLHYQPKINLESGDVTGVEALIRWMNPLLGLVPPAQFVPIAEDCGLIVPIGEWVLREACRQAKAWQDMGLRAVPVAVNISAVQFKHNNFLESLEDILKDTGLAPHFLELDLTESVLMQDVESSTFVLQELKAMGVQLSIDNFGTGYSSLNYLNHFPIDMLKIDQSFVRDITAITTDSDGATLIGAVIGMGKNLKARVVAEGVETSEQLAFLQTLQCDEGQGFHFSHPLCAEEFEALLGSKTNFLQ